MSTASARSRGSYAGTAARRRTIARAVLDLVLEKGHTGVTTAGTAARAGVAEATVLYHFATRDHLLVAALREAFDEDEEQISPGGGVGLDVERLRDYATGLRPQLAQLYTTLAGYAGTPGHPAQDFFAEHYTRARDRWTAIITARQEEGLAHPGLDPAEVARQFLAAWTGLQTQWSVEPSFDLGAILLAAFRRLTGQNWMEARRQLLDPDAGL